MAHPSKKTQEQFLQEALIVHGDRYDYSESTYEGSDIPLPIQCRLHGIFKQRPKFHLQGRGCPKCAREAKRGNTTEFIARAQQVHGPRYRYSKVIYTTNNTCVAIECLVHGLFQQTPTVHLSGSGCPQCAWDLLMIPLQDFIAKANQTHNSRYDYGLVDFGNSSRKISIGCSKHGFFKQEANAHIQGAGCPRCCSSKGETQILDYLTEKGVEFKTQHTFSDLINPKTGRRLRVDFWIPSLTLGIEYDGKQHFQQAYFSRSVDPEKELQDLQFRDEVKNLYFKSRGLELLRIAYTDKPIETLERRLYGKD